MWGRASFTWWLVGGFVEMGIVKVDMLGWRRLKLTVGRPEIGS